MSNIVEAFRKFAIEFRQHCYTSYPFRYPDEGLDRFFSRKFIYSVRTI